MTARLRDRLPTSASPDPGDVLDRFLDWVAEQNLRLYPEQEQAILELFAGRHVVLSTPTGSGKSLVAQALCWKALCEGARSFYTAPVKALVSEKFFAFCDEFGPERVGMLTGDASINRDAPIVCCTTEVLSNMALRHGEALPAPYVVLDEFHYYDDRERGTAWQIPLITLPRTLFLLMSATLGNTAPIEERLARYSGRGVAHVHSDLRPVPLDFEYRETPLHETLDELVRGGLSPVYVVNFTQRECAELAQAATSAAFADRSARARIAESVGEFRFDTPFGKDLRRLISHGIGVHHAGLLPKYRLLVERLAQQGRLHVVFGTDTLGVGVNIPIRTVVFNKLSKWNGEKTALLTVREFLQIAGRAGRKGFDTRGLVLAQAPEHVIENRRSEARAAAGRKKAPKQRPPPGFVGWNEATFRELSTRPPEALRSRFELRHGMLVSVLRREPGDQPAYRELIDLLNRSHETDAVKARLRRHAARLFRALRRAGILELVEAPFGAPEVRVSESLQIDFSLHQTLSLWLHEAQAALDRDAPDYALTLLSLVEAIQEDPDPILREQMWKARRARMAELAAEGVDYDERRRLAEEVSHPRPEQEFIRASFALFAEKHPWVESESVRPKSIAREMVEGFIGFRAYVEDYSLARCEGLLLRYLSQVHNALVKSVPDAAKTEEVFDVIAYLRTLVSRIDSSLIEAWESLMSPAAEGEPERVERAFDLAKNAPALRARARQELLGMVAALARGEYEEAAGFLRQDPDDRWDAARLEAALAPFLAEYGRIEWTPEARRAHWTRLEQADARRWQVTQVLIDATGDHLWALHGEIDLRAERDPEEPLVRLRRIGT